MAGRRDIRLSETVNAPVCVQPWPGSISLLLPPSPKLHHRLETVPLEA